MKRSLCALVALCLSVTGCPLLRFLRDFDIEETCFNGLDDDGDEADDCDDNECSEDLACVTTSEMLEIDLGFMSDGEIETFTIPEGAIGFTILIFGDVGQGYGIGALINPEGEVLIGNFVSLTMRYSILEEAQALVMPSNDNDINAPLPGEWQLSVGSSAEAPRVKVFVRTAPFQTGVLDLKFYIPEGLRACQDSDCNGGQGDIINASNAASFLEIQEALDTFFTQTFEAIGLSEGSVQFFDIDSSFLTIESDRENFAMLRQTELGGSGGMHIFLIQDFSDLSFGGFIGLSPAVPGAFFTVGNQNTGVTMEIMFDTSHGGNLTGSVMSHEVGHFLGLSHTTEFDGTPDFVSDTPVCDASTIGFGDQSQCPDVSFVMFPTIFEVARTFSSGQQLTIHGGPLYR